MTINPAGEYDPITFSVVMARFEAIVTEMTRTLEQAAVTPILALCRDFSCAVYDVQSRQVAMGAALPIQSVSMHLVIDEIGAAFEGDIHDGDVFACNDPFRGNTHVGDLVTACPVFVDGEHRFWAVARGHQFDTGAFQPASVTPEAENIWQEGLTIPPLRLVHRGRECRDVLDLYLTNMRYRESLHGDLLAQLGSIERGRTRIVELCADHGTQNILRYVEALIDYADRRTAEEIRAMPDGTYEAAGWIDGTGFGETDIEIKVTVTIADDQIKIDYSGSSPQVRGGTNSSLACAIAAGACPVLYALSDDIPHNHGCVRHIEVYAPEGTICNATYPASTSAGTVIPADVMQEVVSKALAQAVPERVMAGTARCGNIPQFAGVDPRTGQPWGVMIFNNAGGGGASRETDGWAMLESLAAFGGIRSAPIEQSELLYPLVFEECEVAPESMGFGEWNGAPGTRCAIRSPVSMEYVTFGDGARNPPHGILGGTRAIGGGQYLEDLDTGRRRFLPACAHGHVLPGERWVGVSTGGGGYGDPLDREPELVARDVQDGFIDRDTAEHTFGVVLTSGLRPQVDTEATERLRSGRPRNAGAAVDPTEPAAASWLADHLRPGDVPIEDGDAAGIESARA